MHSGDMLTIQEACDLLNVSLPTLRKYRIKYSISSVKIQRDVKLSKTEVLYRVYTLLKPVGAQIDLDIFSKSSLEDLKIDHTTYDLRKINNIDGHGAISLLCHLVSEMNLDKYIHLIIDETNTFFKAMNFYGELKRYFKSQIFWDEETFEKISNISYDSIIKLPIRRLGIVGAQTKMVDDLTIGLSKQGYSKDICSYIGWAFGELADNSATHSETHPSFVYFAQFGDDKRYLQFTIGDTGIGIPESLRKNSNHRLLSDQQALLASFKPYISGRPDSEKRGKGLTDVLIIAMECGSRLQVGSNGKGFCFAFNSGVDNFEHISPIYQQSGTVISMLFIDGNFASMTREDANKYIDKCMEKI